MLPQIRNFERRLWPISLVNLNERREEEVVVVAITIPTQLERGVFVNLLVKTSFRRKKLMKLR